MFLSDCQRFVYGLLREIREDFQPWTKDSKLQGIFGRKFSRNEL